MTATSGIWNRETAATHAAGVTAMDSSSGNSSSSSTSDPATISSNDFLTLLVTEMQNQDPTATTDPNEYINQLVNVNSLEQLISINQTLSSALGTSSSTTSSSAATSGSSATSIGSTVSTHGVASNASPLNLNQHQVAGNLSIPKANMSAQRVANSLSGNS